MKHFSIGNFRNLSFRRAKITVLALVFISSGVFAGEITELELLRKNVIEQPFSVEALLQLSTYEFEIGSYTESFRHSDIALKLNPKNTRSEYLKLKSLLRLGKWNEVISAVNTNVDPAIDLQILRGFAYVELGKYAVVQSFVRKNATSQEGSADFNELRGDLAFKVSQFQLASDYYDHALRINRRDPELKFKLALVLSRTAKYREANAIFTELLAENPHVEKVNYYYLLNNIRDGRVDIVGIFLKKHYEAKLNPRFISKYYARFLYFIGENDSARNIVNSQLAVNIDDDDALGLRFLITNFQKLEDPAFALKGSPQLTVSRSPAALENEFVYVKDGDTFGKISKAAYGTFIYTSQVMAVNSLLNPKQLKVGTAVLLPSNLAHLRIYGDETYTSLHDYDQILGHSPSNQKRLIAGVQTGSPLELSAPLDFLPDSGFQRHARVSLQMGPSSRKFDLSSTSVQAQIARQTGSYFGLEGDYVYSQKYFLRTTLAAQNTKFTSVAGSSPSFIDTTTYDARLQIGYSLLTGEKITANIFGGYFYQQRTASETSPNLIFSNYKASGPVAGLAASFIVSPRWSLTGEAAGNWHLSHLETTPTSGNFLAGYGLAMSTTLNYKYSSDYELFAGAQYRYEEIRFDGINNRGTRNTVEKGDAVIFPVGIRGRFGK